MPTPPPLDAEIAAFLDAFPIDLGGTMGALTDDSVGGVREMLEQFPKPEPTGKVEQVDHDVPGTDGVKVRVYRPAGAAGDLPCIYWIHGGGLVIGSYDEDPRFDVWCHELQCMAVSVEYRLAPEHPYPAAIDDCLAGLQWTFANADDLQIDASRIGIGGPSAGAGLAAALALRVRDETDLDIKYQMLVYPMLDDRQTTVSSQWPERIWPPAANTYGWTSYLGDAKGGPDVSPYAAPARATDLAGLPPALILVGSADGFHDEDVDYAVRLNHAAVDVELHVYPGAPHGFDNLTAGTELANRANRDMLEWLRAHI